MSGVIPTKWGFAKMLKFSPMADSWIYISDYENMCTVFLFLQFNST